MAETEKKKTSTTGRRKFIEKVAEIQSECQVEKSLYNDFADFSYRTAESILAKVKPLCAAKKMAILLTDTLVTEQSARYIKATAILTDGDESIEAEAYAEIPADKKKMDKSQITGSTASYARKMALNGLFGISDKTDADDPRQMKEEHRPLTEDEVQEVETAIKEYGINLSAVLETYRVKEIREMTANNLENFRSVIRKKAMQKRDEQIGEKDLQELKEILAEKNIDEKKLCKNYKVASVSILTTGQYYEILKNIDKQPVKAKEVEL